MRAPMIFGRKWASCRSAMRSTFTPFESWRIPFHGGPAGRRAAARIPDRNAWLSSIDYTERGRNCRADKTESSMTTCKTGADHIKSLKDGRRVYIDGTLVA